MDEKIELMHKIFDVAMRINGGAVTRNGAGHPTAFVYYSGHVNWIEVYIYEDGWTRGSNYNRRFEFNFNKDVSRLKETFKEFREYAFMLRFRRRKACGMI